MKGLRDVIFVSGALTFVGGTILFASGVCAEGWRSYHNDRFGTTADVPAGWKMEPPPANDDGRIFTSPDGRAQLIVNGSYAGVVDPDELRSRLEPMEGETIAYKQRKGDWAVVSGRKATGFSTARRGSPAAARSRTMFRSNIRRARKLDTVPSSLMSRLH